MKILKNTGRKNRLIKNLRVEIDKLHGKIAERSLIVTDMKINELEWYTKLTSSISILKKENQELLEYKAKYYSLIKTLKL